MNTQNASLETVAAQALADLLPSPIPLTPANGPATTTPPASAQAVYATFVGQLSAELVVVPHQDVIAALEEAGNLSLAEALRPALEAAAETLGSGVLSPAEQRNTGDVLSGANMTLVELVGEGTTQAWFGLSVRGDAPDRQAAQAGPSGSTADDAQGVGGQAPAPQQAGGQQFAAQPAAFPPLDNQRSLAAAEAGMRVLYDVEMTLTVEIGRTRLPVRDVLELVPGTVLELDRSAGAPADIMVNGRLVARGEIVVVDDEYAVRVSEIVSSADGVR